MSLFEQLNREATKRDLRFLVIGGHAVIEHGFQRGTDDADILICRSDVVQWCEVAKNLGYQMLRDGGTFMQFESREAQQWNLDLMVVPEQTFNGLLAAAKAARLEGAAVAVPSLEHLLALKVHALKHGRGLRVLKDMTDVAQLLIVNRIDPKSDWLRALFEKHGDMGIYERVIQLLT
jgi:predicted nucleotidyltransferase